MKIYILNLAWFPRCDRKNENVANIVTFWSSRIFLGPTYQPSLLAPLYHYVQLFLYRSV